MAIDKESQFDKIMCDAIEQVRSGETNWTHFHLDEYLADNDLDANCEIISKFICRILSMSDWKNNGLHLNINIRIKESDGVEVEHPRSISEALLENRDCDEPPSISVSRQADFKAGVQSGSAFFAEIHDSYFVDILPNYMKIIYITRPFDNNDYFSGWGRSVCIFNY